MAQPIPQVIVGAPAGKEPFDIMVPTHNHLELTIQCIDALYACTRTPFHLIIIDDSPDLTPLYLRQLQKEKPDVTIYHGEVQSGNHFFNLALERCKSPYLATVMNSVIVEPDWENVALQLMANDPKIGVIGFKCLFAGEIKSGYIESAGIQMVGFTPSDVGRDLPGHRLTTIYDCQSVQWAFALLRVEAVKGKLENNLFNPFRGWDDIDNSFVIKEAGWKIVYDGLGVGYHYPRATRGNNSEQAYVENIQNAELFYKRHGFWAQFKEATPKTQELVEEKDGKLIKKDISATVAALVAQNKQGAK